MRSRQFVIGIVGFVILVVLHLVWRHFFNVRHMLFNNSVYTLYLYTEHTKQTVPAGTDRQINPIGLPYRVMLEKPTGTQIEFGSDGVIEVRHSPSYVISRIRPPESWAVQDGQHKLFRYQLNSDGNLYLLSPSAKSPSEPVERQPEGFPIQTFGEKASLNQFFERTRYARRSTLR
jgi:hypothetical protein